MKSLKGKIVRVSDERASELYQEGFIYLPKSEWISYIFWLATKWGYQGFGNLWAVRFMGFSTSMLTFPIMTYLYLGEAITLKTGITVILAIIIMLLQLI